MRGTLCVVLGALQALCVQCSYMDRSWTYQSTIRVDAMGMEGSAFAMHGRGLTTIAQGADIIYETTDAAGSPLAKPSTVWVGSCVYETDEEFVRCVNRKSPVYNDNSNFPVCTLSFPDRTILTADTYCDGPGVGNAPYYYYSAPYDPGVPATRADDVGDQYGAHVSLAGDLEAGSILAVGAPKTYTSDGSPYLTANTFQDTYGAVYMHTGEYKRWTENQKLVPNDSNLFLTSNQPNFGQIVELDQVTSRTAMISCPQCVSVSTTEGAVYVYKSKDGKMWSVTQQLISDDATTSDFEFGKNVKIHDEFAMIAASGLSTRGALYIFREERHSTYKDGVYNGQWTQQQKLVPTDAYIRTSGTLWGNKADMHGKTLVVGQSTEPTYGTSTGAAYVYKSSMTMEFPDNHLWDSDRRALRDVHAEGVKPKPIPMHKYWSQVQKLYPSDPHVYRLFGDEVSIWGDVIAVTGTGESLGDADWFTPGTYYQFGSVYMFSRESFGSDVWTQQQKLYNPDANDGTYFSNSVDTDYQNNLLGPGDLDYNRFGVPRLYGSSLAVTSYGDTPFSAYTYFMTDNLDWKCLQITVGDGMGDGWDRARLVATAPFGPTREVKTDTFSQFCDAYNYDKRDEMIPLSRKTQETYRYCPLDARNAGDYVFEILGNPRGKKGDKGTPSDDLYWREIYWDIYNEFDKKRYIGDAHTKLTFNWGEHDFFFTLKKSERLWKPPASCTQCNIWKGLQKEGQQQPKPKAKALRRLSDNDADDAGNDAGASRRLNLYPTPAPTSTASPTMSWDQSTYVDQWMFVMGRNESAPNARYGSTTAWTDKFKNGTGTYFYIYDSNGLNITEPLIWGQLCTLTGTIKDSCTTQDLPVGGTYTLRVTGGMDYRRNEIEWKFCNVIGHAQHTLVFTKYSSTCLPIALYDTDEMCEKKGFQVKTSITAILKGLIGLYSEARDTAVVESALKTMLHPYITSSISIFVEQESLHGSSTEDVVLVATVEFDSQANGIDVNSLDWLHDFESGLLERLGYYDNNQMIPSVLSNAAHKVLGDDTKSILSGASFQSQILDVQILQAETKKLKVVRSRVQSTAAAQENKDDNNNAEVSKLTMSSGTRIEYSILNAEAIAGYVVMSCILLAVVLVSVVSWHQNWKKTKLQGQRQDLTEKLGGTAVNSAGHRHVDFDNEWKKKTKKTKRSAGRVTNVSEV